MLGLTVRHLRQPRGRRITFPRLLRASITPWALAASSDANSPCTAGRSVPAATLRHSSSRHRSYSSGSPRAIRSIRNPSRGEQVAVDRVEGVVDGLAPALVGVGHDGAEEPAAERADERALRRVRHSAHHPGRTVCLGESYGRMPDPARRGGDQDRLPGLGPRGRQGAGRELFMDLLIRISGTEG